MFGFILGLIVGGAQPFQTSINSRLRESLRSPLLSSCASFGTALIAISAVLMVLQHNIYIPLSAVASEPFWIWTGGLCGDVIVIFSILCLPKLGSVETVVFLVLGQIVSGLYIDNYGSFGAAVIPVTALKMVGAALVLIGVIIVSYAGSKADVTGGGARKWLYRFLDFIAGVACSLQIAINGTLGVVVDSSIRATTISMIFGLSGAVLISVLLVVFKGRGALIDYSIPASKTKWWMWTGGLAAAVIVGGNVILAELLGTGLAAILNILGQTAAGVVIDATGFLGIEKKAITIPKLAGLVVMVVGTALISYF